MTIVLLSVHVRTALRLGVRNKSRKNDAE